MSNTYFVLDAGEVKQFFFNSGNKRPREKDLFSMVSERYYRGVIQEVREVQNGYIISCTKVQSIGEWDELMGDLNRWWFRP